MIMLKDRIIATLRFFDLQDWPLTLLELRTYLTGDLNGLYENLNDQWELREGAGLGQAAQPVSLGQVLASLETECGAEVECASGFYCLTGRTGIVQKRLENYLYGIEREKKISKYIGALKFLPFVRGAALTGSQAMGPQRQGSDIDLLIVVEPGYLWLARTLVTAYFHVIGQRRHGAKIADRFCLNHYVAGPKKIKELQNLYTAWEYAKLRPLIGVEEVKDFQKQNHPWIRVFFPNFSVLPSWHEPAPAFRLFMERLLEGRFGAWAEKTLRGWQLPKIRQEKFILVKEDELSFHPQSKQQNLLKSYFAFQTPAKAAGDSGTSGI